MDSFDRGWEAALAAMRSELSRVGMLDAVAHLDQAEAALEEFRESRRRDS
ncbi:MAG: hypothetical protein ACRDPQ_02715 [Nocardioidaceae bacterium]